MDRFFDVVRYLNPVNIAGFTALQAISGQHASSKYELTDENFAKKSLIPDFTNNRQAISRGGQAETVHRGQFYTLGFIPIEVESRLIPFAVGGDRVPWTFKLFGQLHLIYKRCSFVKPLMRVNKVFNSDFIPVCWSKSRISNPNFNSRVLLTFATPEKMRAVSMDVRSGLVAAHSSCLRSHFAGFRKRHIDQSDGANAKDNPEQRGRTHYLGEESHSLLRIKILIGAIMVMGGLYFLLNTASKGLTIKPETHLINAILSILCITLGCFFASYSMFSLVGR